MGDSSYHQEAQTKLSKQWQCRETQLREILTSAELSESDVFRQSHALQQIRARLLSTNSPSLQFRQLYQAISDSPELRPLYGFNRFMEVLEKRVYKRGIRVPSCLECSVDKKPCKISQDGHNCRRCLERGGKCIFPMAAFADIVLRALPLLQSTTVQMDYTLADNEARTALSLSPVSPASPGELSGTDQSHFGPLARSFDQRYDPGLPPAEHQMSDAQRRYGRGFVALEQAPNAVSDDLQRDNVLPQPFATSIIDDYYANYFNSVDTNYMVPPSNDFGPQLPDFPQQIPQTDSFLQQGGIESFNAAEDSQFLHNDYSVN